MPFESETYVHISFEQSSFRNLHEILQSPITFLQRAVMPIVKVRGEEYSVIGTAFAIAGHCLMTARHVVDELIALKPEVDAGDLSIGALYATRAGDGFPVPPGTPWATLLPVNRLNFNRSTDIALLDVSRWAFDGDPLRFAAMALSLLPPPVGRPCMTLGYTATIAGGASNLSITPTLNGSKGEVREVLLRGRDTSLINFPCFQISARFDFQMSGSPIMTSHEPGTQAIYGVVSTGYDLPENEEPLGYASLLFPALGLTSMVKETEESEPIEMTLFEMGRKGVVTLNGLSGFEYDPTRRVLRMPF
jgi:hypothetical protein